MSRILTWAQAFWHRAKLKASAVGLDHEAQELRERIEQIESACTLPDGRYIVLPIAEEALERHRAALRHIEARRQVMAGRLRAAGA